MNAQESGTERGGSIARTYGVCGAANRATAKPRKRVRTHARVAVTRSYRSSRGSDGAIRSSDERLEPRPRTEGCSSSDGCARYDVLRVNAGAAARGRTCRRRRGTLIAAARPIAMNHLLLA